MDTRLIELEIKAAYQEDLLTTLNEIIANQQQQIERLEKTCSLLNEKLHMVVMQQPEEAVADISYEIPPHY